ncbi:DUF2752 domain-containing protein [Dysgonomonas sp. 216]|uniref:DUF2752 domain-containing protein n=1 Tax=Dysgonomonas sp. 216 TaxID=2302934 RepID=UPI0013D669F1|nr:DUF2752 domain-containing protein [Dysgonomonas sp. 216]
MLYNTITNRLRNYRWFIYVKIAGIIIFPVTLYLIPVGWLNEQHSICLFKNIFGIECFGCGITRAIVSAIQFDFVGAFNFNKLIVIVFPLLIFIWIRMLIQQLKLLKH